MKKYIKANIVHNIDLSELVTEEDAKTIGNDSVSNYKIYKDKKNNNITASSINENLKEFLEKEFTQQTSKRLRKINSYIQSPDYPHAIGRIEKGVAGEDAFLITNIKPYFDREKYKDKIPNEQLQKAYHLMEISKATHCYIITLIGNEETYIEKIDHNPEKAQILMKKEMDFIQNNLDKSIAPIPISESEYNKENGLILYEKESMIEHYDEVVVQIKTLEENKKVIEQALKDEMKEEELAYVGNRKITYKNVSRSTIDSKKLRKECPEIAQMYTRTSVSKIFKVN